MLSKHDSSTFTNILKRLFFIKRTIGQNKYFFPPPRWGGGPSLHKGINPVKRGIFRPLAHHRHPGLGTRSSAPGWLLRMGVTGPGDQSFRYTDLHLQWTVTLLIIFYARLLSDLDTNHDVHRYVDTGIDISHWLLDTIHDMHAWPWQCWWWRRKLNGT